MRDGEADDWKERRTRLCDKEARKLMGLSREEFEELFPRIPITDKKKEED